VDPESVEWLRILSPAATDHSAGLRRLHARLVRVALHEVARRGQRVSIVGPESVDIANQAADDAMLAILAKLDTFRGESRFTTWMYKFVILEVSHKIGRHHWQSAPQQPLPQEDWDRLPDRFGIDPSHDVEAVAMVAAVRQAVYEVLTEHQRRLFIAVVLDGVPLDALVVRLGTNRNAIYKAVFDARRNIRTFLVDNGYLHADGGAGKP
jgi:RNA polymerase sigma-70 factor (ECF subfamily)